MTFAALVKNLVTLGNMLVTVLFALAFVFFFINVLRYFFFGQGSEEAVQKGRNTLLYSGIGFVVLFAMWGIIGLLVNTLNSTVGAAGTAPTQQNAAQDHSSTQAETPSEAQTPPASDSSTP